LLAAGRPEEANRTASARLTASKCDVALAEIARGQFGPGLERLQDALNQDPHSEPALHNLVAALIQRGQLKGQNLDCVSKFVARHLEVIPWVRAYRQILYLPRFLNLEFVSGKCNLNCRMCVSRHAPGHPGKLSHLPADDFRRFLAAAPTITGLTLSSGDSDPLLHPEIDRIAEIARESGTRLDFYTNGHPLTVRSCRAIVHSQAVTMMNFSVDAATPETYRRIRGTSLQRLLGKVEMLASMKREHNVPWPWVSFSFVAMADNIAELPAFIDLAADYEAKRVFVADLVGWGSGSGGNQLATDHPRWEALIEEAKRRARKAGLFLKLPERLDGRSIPAPVMSPGLPDPDSSPTAEGPSGAGDLPVCGWLLGLWIASDGRLDPCCLLHEVADMGNLKDGPLWKNAKFTRIKDLLLSGRVFPKCLEQRECLYVQQQRKAGVRLQIIEPHELGGPFEASPSGRIGEAGGVQPTSAVTPRPVRGQLRQAVG
jgi:MoaA/NifB/PqqE/SkfB family radical SAM enzyme